MIAYNIEQGTMEWLQLRLGKITSSRLKQVMSSKSLDLVDELIDELETGYISDDTFISDAMQRGTDLEPIAVKEYEAINGVTTTQVGFLQSDTIDMVGLSPDRLVGDVGALEVKCPNTKNHIRAIRHDKLPTMHRHQIIMYFIVHTKLEWVDFMSYDPRLEKKPVFIKRVTRDELAEDIAECEDALRKFVKKFNDIYSNLFF